MKQKNRYFAVTGILIIPLLFLIFTSVTPTSLASGKDAAMALTPTPVFRYPLFRDQNRIIEISGWFDHSGVSDQFVTFFDGRKNTPGYGFLFSCPQLMYWPDWVGCLDAVTGEENCSDTRELWYDAHRGTDYEYETDWHTGDLCDLDRFSNRQPVPVFAPADGQVYLVQRNHAANGNAVWLMHDLESVMHLGNFSNGIHMQLW